MTEFYRILQFLWSSHPKNTALLFKPSLQTAQELYCHSLCPALMYLLLIDNSEADLLSKPTGDNPGELI